MASDALNRGVFSSRAWPWYDTMHAVINHKRGIRHAVVLKEGCRHDGVKGIEVDVWAHLE
jgi:hypothetical protein